MYTDFWFSYTKISVYDIVILVSEVWFGFVYETDTFVDEKDIYDDVFGIFVEKTSTFVTRMERYGRNYNVYDMLEFRDDVLEYDDDDL